MSTNHENSPTAEQEIRQLLDGYFDAMRAKDAAGSVAFHAPGIVQFLLAPPLQYAGSTQMGEATVAEWFATFKGPLEFELRDLVIVAGESIAFARFLNHMLGKKVTGEKMDLWIRDTMGFEKIDGAWKITHEHESVPFDMETFAACLQLKP